MLDRLFAAPPVFVVRCIGWPWLPPGLLTPGMSGAMRGAWRRYTPNTYKAQRLRMRFSKEGDMVRAAAASLAAASSLTAPLLVRLMCVRRLIDCAPQQRRFCRAFCWSLV